MSAPRSCPNGALAISPGLRGTSYPGYAVICVPQPQRGCGALSVRPGHNPVGVVWNLQRDTQGSRCAATLGWRPQSRWDCLSGAHEDVVDRSPSPRPSPRGRGGGQRHVLPIRMPGLQSPSRESGAEATAVQTLRDGRMHSSCTKRLDCGAFTAAYVGQAFQPAGAPDFPVWFFQRATGKSPAPADRNVRPTGTGRGEGECHTIWLSEHFRTAN
jgi:hypothetical protein